MKIITKALTICLLLFIVYYPYNYYPRYYQTYPYQVYPHRLSPGGTWYRYRHPIFRPQPPQYTYPPGYLVRPLRPPFIYLPH